MAGRGLGIWPIVILIGLAGVSGTFGDAGSPADSFDPFCGVSNRYLTQAKIEFEGEVYASTVTRRVRYVRPWIRNLNSAGCGEEVGTSHIFRSASKRVIMFPSAICSKASGAVRQTGRADALALCKPDHRYWETSGTIVDNADNPTRWQAFWFDGRELPDEGGFHRVRLVEWTATATSNPPADKHAELVPALMNVDYRKPPKAKPVAQSGERRYITHYWPKGRISSTRRQRDRAHRTLRYEVFLQ
ncbi:MAG: hypothetical protein AAFR13_03145 [Pseudomonadota bacterium]